MSFWRAELIKLIGRLTRLETFFANKVVTVNYFDHVPSDRWAGILNGTDTSDQKSSLRAFRDALAAISDAGNDPHGVIPSCTIRASVMPNFAIMRLNLDTQGTRFICTGAGPGFKADGTGLGPGAFGVQFMKVGPFIASTTTGNDGIYIRKVLKSKFEGILNLGAVVNGIYIDGCVSTEFTVSCTNQPEAFLATPAVGLNVTGPNAGGSSANCTFYTSIFEQVPIGIQLGFSLFNVIVGGVAEGCTNTGLAIGADGKFNTVMGGDFEANTTFDIYCEGAYNNFVGVRSVKTKFDTATCVGNRIDGGHHDTLTFGAATLRNVVDKAVITTLTDPTTGQNGNRYHNCINTAGGWHRDWISTTPAVTSGANSLTSASGALRYVVDGNTVHFVASATITTNGTGSQDIRIVLPFASSVLAGFGGEEVGNTLKAIVGFVAASSTALIMRFYDGTYPGANGNVLTITGTYQRA